MQSMESLASHQEVYENANRAHTLTCLQCIERQLKKHTAAASPLRFARIRSDHLKRQQFYLLPCDIFVSCVIIID